MKSLRVKESGAHFGIRDAIALNPTAFCEGCNRVVREKELMGDLCSACYFEYEPKGGDAGVEAKPEKQGDEGLPIRGRERVIKVLVDRQMMLPI